MPFRKPLRLGLALFSFIGLIGLILLHPGTASAHAQLVRTVPAAGSELASSPKTLEIVFAESVRPVNGGIRVLNEDGKRVDEAKPKTAKDEVTLTLPLLPKGAYVVSWRVVSDDGHPIRGAFTFRVGGVGSQATAAKLAEKLLVAGTSQTATSAVSALLRILTFCAIAILLGAAVHLFAVDRQAIGNASIRTIKWSTIVAGVSGIGAVLLYGPTVSGRSLGAIADGTLLDDTLGDRVGQAIVTRTVISVLLGIVVLTIAKSNARTRAIGAGLAAMAISLGLAQAFTGHGGTGKHAGLALPMTAVHLLAMGAWAGGLVMLLLALKHHATNPGRALRVTKIFSRNAGVAVAALAISGSFAIWRQAGSLSVLRNTPSGNLILIKLGLVAALLLVGAKNRRTIGLGNSQASKITSTIGRTLLFEIVGMVAVLGLTALIVNLPPARDVAARPVAVTVKTDTGLVDITIDPARKGRNKLHIYALTAEGATRPIKEITATLSNQDTGVEKLEARLLRAGSNHFQDLGLDLPLAGTWQIDVAITIDEFTEETGSSTFTLK